MRQWLTADRIGGGVFVFLGIMALAEGWRLYPMRSRGIASDEAFPILLGVVMVGLGGSLALFSKPQKRPVSWPKGRQRILLLEAGLTLILYWVMLPRLGFPVSTFLAAYGLSYTIGNFRWYGCLLFSAILASAFYGLFIFWLKIPFPAGVLGI